MKTWMAAVLAALAGCATTTGPSKVQELTGDPYDVVTRHDVIAGEVCGVPVNYAVSREHGQIVLLGAGSRRLAIRDEQGARHVIDLESGHGVGAVPVLDVWIAADRIAGHVGGRSFALQADGDGYRGTYLLPGTSAEQQGAMEVAGRAELLQMPRAQLAAIVGPLLSCERRGWGHSPSTLIQPTIAVRFGGPAHVMTSAAR